ncbi:histidine--tRNA ligase [Dorcoceras hygrometricum]|uniref:Histidine--tRNA ligase n=1 Tax=Dorcoceras hygrometricum TaxID=472368 RepID=A0A2Z7A180_9LAMI|nr:histidine--tRNA ligase [Dorcoceras hygrometricum]
MLYGDGTKSKRHMGRETFVFGGTCGSRSGICEINLNVVLFCCSNATILLADGMLGLGYIKYSLLAQTSSS